MKLHLGCGQVHLDGYVNIDFPPDKHTIQVNSKADEFHDLLSLRYKKESINEVRLHHVYEHFTRPVSLALLASWHSWLKIGGEIHIEVPDFDRTAKVALNRLTSENNKMVALRHIFGSNEADWATHYEGWNAARLRKVYELAGFEVVREIKSSYKATRNIALIGRKTSTTATPKQLHEKAETYLANFLVARDDPMEKHLLSVWLDMFDSQLSKTIAK